MPKLDGWSVLRRLQEDPFLRDIPVIIFTTYFDDQNRKLAVRGGFQIEKKPTNETDYHVFIGKLASYIYN
jgi:CheY-like chemotaxis protein